MIFNFQFGVCVFAPKHPSEFGSGMGMLGGPGLACEGLRLCGAVLGACVGMSARHPHTDGERRGATERLGVGTQTSISLDGLRGECERKRSDA